MNKLWKMCTVLLAALLCGAFFLTAAAEEETDPEWIQEFQKLTDAVNGLTEDSTSEEVEAVHQLFEDTRLEMQDEEGNSLAGSMSVELGPTDSIQDMFAKLQLQQSQVCKENAGAYIAQIQKIQQDQKMAAEYIEEARALQEAARTTGEETEMPEGMQQYMKEKGLPWDETGGDFYHTAEEWDYNIKSLAGYQEILGSQVQTQMVYLQDFVGQYNSYLQGANSAIHGANQTLTSIARGQTMLGGGSTGLLVTGVLGGVIVGVGGTLLVIRLRKRSKKATS